MKLFLLIMAVLAGFLLTGILVLMMPSVQRQIFLYFIEPNVDQVALEFIQVRPFSTELSDFYVREGEAEIWVGSVHVEYGFIALLSGLFTGEVDLTSVRVERIWLKPPPPDEEEPFAGIFDPLIFDGRVQVDELDVSGRVFLEEARSWDFHVRGEGLGFGRMGDLSFSAHLVDDEGYNGELRFAFEGMLEIREDDAGHPEVLILQGGLYVDGIAQAEIPPLHAHLIVARSEVETGNDSLAGQERRELYSLTLADPNGEMLGRVSALLETTFDLLRGEIYLRMDHRFVERLAPAVILPVVTGDAKGSFSFDTLGWDGAFDGEVSARAGGLEILHPAFLGFGSLNLHAEGAGALDEGVIRMAALRGALRDDRERGVVEFQLPVPLEIDLAAPTLPMRHVDGDFLHVYVFQLFLPWISPFLPEVVVEEGRLSTAFALGRDQEENGFLVRFIRSLEIDNLSVSFVGEEEPAGWLPPRPLVSAVNITVDPEVSLIDGRLSLRYENVEIRSEGAFLIQGEGEVSFFPWEIGRGGESTGDFSVALDQLSAQPIARPWLEGRLLDPVVLQSRHRVRLENEALWIETLTAGFRLPDESEAMRVEVTRPFTIDLHDFQNGEEPWTGFFKGGEMRIEANELPLYWWDPFVRDAGIAFGDDGWLSAAFIIRGENDGVWAIPEENVHVAALSLEVSGRQMVEDLDLSFMPRLFYSGEVVAAAVENLTVFSQEGVEPILSASAAITLRAELNDYFLTRAEGTFSGDLVSMLRQPVAFPHHPLVSGSVQGHVVLTQEDWDVTLELRDVAGAEEEFLITELAAEGTGAWRPDGFAEGTVSVFVNAGSGGSGLDFVLGFFPGRGEEQADELVIAVEGERLFPAELIAFGRALVADEVADEEEVEELVAPFWAFVPFNVVMEAEIGVVAFPDEVAVTGVTLRGSLTSERLELENWTASLNDGILFLDATLFFSEERGAYMLHSQSGWLHFHPEYLDAMVEIELAQNYPWPDGVFQVLLTLAGEGDDVAKLISTAHLDLHVVGTGGIFHPFPLEAQLLEEGRRATAAAGEFLSYLPTGGFGVGALARFVTFLHEFSYDHLIVRAERLDDLDLRLLHFILQSQHVRFSAEGRVAHEQGVPFLEQTLEFKGSLNAVGRAAAIMAQMDLIEPERDEFGYFRGIEFEVWGTVLEPETNFADIVIDAATDMLARGFFRPFAGILSNIIYMGTTRDDPPREEIERLPRRRHIGPTRRLF